VGDDDDESKSIKISTVTTSDALTPRLPALMHGTTLSAWQRRTASLMDRRANTTTTMARRVAETTGGLQQQLQQRPQ